MALQKTITVSSGLIATNSYVRINSLSGSKNGVDISVGIYASLSSFSNHMSAVDEKIYHFIPDVSDSAVNFIEQGYQYLKTLDDFKDAVDC